LVLAYLFPLNRGRERVLRRSPLPIHPLLSLLSFSFLFESAYMRRRFLSERGGEQGGGLIDPFVNPEHDVKLKAVRGSAVFLCEALFRMEVCADFL